PRKAPGGAGTLGFREKRHGALQLLLDAGRLAVAGGGEFQECPCHHDLPSLRLWTNAVDDTLTDSRRRAHHGIEYPGATGDEGRTGYHTCGIRLQDLGRWTSRGMTTSRRPNRSPSTENAPGPRNAMAMASAMSSSADVRSRNRPSATAGYQKNGI